MNGIQFIKEKGVDKARKVIDGAPEWAKEHNLKNGNDQRVFALKFCIHEIKKAMR